MSVKVSKKKKWDLLMQLRDAIKKRNKKRAKQLLLKNTIVDDPKCKSAHTLIHWAILRFQDTEILKILIDQGANVCAKNYRNQTPLNLAIKQKNFKAIKLLLSNKAYAGENYKVLLETAITNESEKLVKLLVACGVKNKLFKNLNGLLDLAVTMGLAKIVKIIIPHCKFSKTKKHISEVNILIGDRQFNECLNILLQHGFRMESGCEENDTFVFDSIKYGYLAIVKELLSLGLNVNMISEKTGLTLLHTACLYKQHKIVELLLKHRANLNCIVKRGTLVWHRSSFAEKLKSLIGKTPLFIAVDITDAKLLDIILNHGAVIPYNPEFMILVSRAIRYDHLEVIKVFIKHGFDVNAITSDGKYLLHDCANCETQLIHIYTSQTLRCNHSIKCQIVQLLLKHGANIDSHGPDLETPLFTAIKNNYSKMVDFFLELNANIYHTNVDGNTLLHIAAKESWISTCIVTRLLEYKINVNEPNTLGITPFHFACKNWNSKLIQILIDHGAEINLQDSNGQTPIHFAAEGQDVEVARLLLKNGASVTNTDYCDRTPVHILCSQFAEPSVDILKLFLQYGANINAYDAYDKTPLVYACKRGNIKTIKMLLANHANVNRIDTYGATAVHVAAECCAKAARFLMGRKTTITDLVSREGKTLFHTLLEERHFDLIEEYINILNIHIDTPDKFGRTPLHHSASAVQEHMVTILLQYGADINVSNDQQPTVPMYIYARMIKINRELTKLLQQLRQNPNEFENYARLRNQYIPYWQKMGYYKRIMHILRQHIIKLKIAGMRLHPQNVRFSIYDHTNTDIYVDDLDAANFESYELLCNNEIKMLQTVKILGTDFYLYDILIKDTHTLANHTSLVKIKSFLKKDYLVESFPIYIDLIKYHFAKTIRRSKLLNVARRFAEPTILFGLSEICTNQIFSYINNNEMKIFNQAVRVVRYLNPTEKEDLKVLLKTDSAKFLRELKPIETNSTKYNKKIKRY